MATTSNLRDKQYVTIPRFKLRLTVYTQRVVLLDMGTSARAQARAN